VETQKARKEVTRDDGWYDKICICEKQGSGWKIRVINSEIYIGLGIMKSVSITIRPVISIISDINHVPLFPSDGDATDDSADNDNYSDGSGDCDDRYQRKRTVVIIGCKTTNRNQKQRLGRIEIPAGYKETSTLKNYCNRMWA